MGDAAMPSRKLMMPQTTLMMPTQQAAPPPSPPRPAAEQPNLGPAIGAFPTNTRHQKSSSVQSAGLGVEMLSHARN